MGQSTQQCAAHNGMCAAQPQINISRKNIPVHPLNAILTHHFQLDHIGVPVALHIRGGAGVVPGLVTSDTLEGQVAAAHNHTRSLVVLDDLVLQLAGLVIIKKIPEKYMYVNGR